MNHSLESPIASLTAADILSAMRLKEEDILKTIKREKRETNLITCLIHNIDTILHCLSKLYKCLDCFSGKLKWHTGPTLH